MSPPTSSSISLLILLSTKIHVFPTKPLFFSESLKVHIKTPNVVNIMYSIKLHWCNRETSSLFQILYNQQSVEVQGNLKRKLITQLQPDTDYSFVLMSRGNSAGGLQQQVSIRTAPDLLKMKPARYQHDGDEGGRVTVSLPRVPVGVPIRSVLSLCPEETILKNIDYL